MDMIEVAIKAVEEVFDWKQFLAEYYSEEENPVEALVASEAELAISGSLIHGNEETRTIDLEEQKAENSAETELTPEQKYIQTGKELEYGMNDTERDAFSSVYEVSDESESTVYDNSYDDSDDGGESYGYGEDDHDDPSAIEGFEFMDTASYVIDNQSEAEEGEELSEEEVVAGFEFEAEQKPEEQYSEDVPMFKQKRLEDK